MKYGINIVLNYKNKTFDRKNEIKIKYDKLSIFRTNKNEYVISIGAVCLTSTILLLIFEKLTKIK